MVLVQSLASRNWNGPSFKMCYRQDLTKMCHCVCVLYPSELRLYDDSLHSEYHYYISAKKWSFARARRTWLDLLGQRDHPFKTSAKFHDFWPLPPPVGSFLLLSIGKFGKFLTPPPLKNAYVLNGWSPTKITQDREIALPLSNITKENASIWNSQVWIRFKSVAKKLHL